MSSVGEYDKGMINKFKSVFPNVIFSPGEETALYTQASYEDDYVVKLPLITINRINQNVNDSMYVDSEVRRGRVYDVQEEKLMSIPIILSYQIDIYSDKREEVDDIWREVVRFIKISPNIEIEIKRYNIKTEFPLMLIDSDTTTDVSSFDDKGRLYRITMNTEINQARLFFSKDYNPVKDIPVRIITLSKKEW